MALNDIVDVVVTRETAQLTRVGFGTPLLLVTHEVIPDVAKLYGSLDEMEDDGFDSTDIAWQMANALLQQDPKVKQFVLGKRTRQPTRIVKLTPKATPLANTLYRVTLNGVDFDYTTDATPTVAEITGGLTTLIDAGSVNVNATDNTTDMDVQAAATPGGVAEAGVPFTCEYDRALFDFKDNTPDAGIAADISDVRDANDNWYAITGDWWDEDTAVAAAAVIETLQRIHLWSNGDTDVLEGGTTTDVFSVMNGSEYDRSGGFWHSKPHDSPAARLMGKVLPLDPGQATWKFQGLTGIDFDTFTSGEQTALTAKKANSNIRVAGNNMTQEGWMHSGEFIDTMRGIDFVTQRIKEDVFFVLLNADKIPYTDLGVSAIQGAVEGVLQSATRQGGGSGQIFTNNPAPITEVPLVADIPAATRASRTLPDVTWRAQLAGAIHKVEVRGRVSV